MGRRRRLYHGLKLFEFNSEKNLTINKAQIQCDIVSAADIQ